MFSEQHFTSVHFTSLHFLALRRVEDLVANCVTFFHILESRTLLQWFVLSSHPLKKRMHGLIFKGSTVSQV